jgi:hypothetical protein
MFHILHDGLLTNGLLDPSLRLHVEWVRIERSNLALLGKLCFLLPGTRLTQEFCEAAWV